MSLRVLVAGFQHETNTFAPSLADWAAFTRGDAFPALVRGAALQTQLSGVNLPIGGFMAAAQAQGWTLLPSVWAGASPSSYVSEDAFERICAVLLEDLDAALQTGLDAVYLDLHGAAVAQHVDDAEGELLRRVRQRVGPHRPVVASLDLHANVTPLMLSEADALVAYRRYPHVDMADTGARAAQLLARRVQHGSREALHTRRLPFLIPLGSQSTDREPAHGHYQALAELERASGTVLSFCMGFPAADFADCGPVVWGHGAQAREAVEALYQRVSTPAPWRFSCPDADTAVRDALSSTDSRPVVIADTQDNPGAGGDSNTTGLLHALLRQGAGHAWPGQVALGLLADPQAAALACAAGVGARLPLQLGRSVPTFGGAWSDPPLEGEFSVRGVSDGRCTLSGPMMHGARLNLGPCAALEIQGVLIAVSSGKVQMLDRALFRMLGIQPEAMRLLVVKSSNHFRADFGPIASHIIVARAAGPMAADPAALPWRKLASATRTAP